jgi:hypothetical protein
LCYIRQSICSFFLFFFSSFQWINHILSFDYYV